MNTIKDFLLGHDTKHSNYTSAVLLWGRMFAGLMMLPYGWGKITNYDAYTQDFFGDPIGIGNVPSLWLTIFAQLVCPFFLMTGLMSRPAAFFLFFNMVVATKYHFMDPWGKVGLPLVFTGLYFILMMLGPGKYSLDNLFSSKPQTIYPYQWAGVAITILTFALAWMLVANTFSGILTVVLSLVALALWYLALRLLK